MHLRGCAVSMVGKWQEKGGWFKIYLFLLLIFFVVILTVNNRWGDFVEKHKMF
jgi:hypothetical protein